MLSVRTILGKVLPFVLLVGLAAGVRADELPRGSPEELGFSAARLDYIDQFYSEKVKRGEMAGIVTLVARNDIYGELHKAFASITDTQHLDFLPRLELIDAVDADGDGRGELLFRRISDAGKAFVLYRVVGDRLWPLFEGMPGQ